MTATLVTRRALLDRRVSLTWWGVGIFLYTSMIMAVWPVIDGNDEFDELLSSYPESIKAFMGGAEAFDAFTTPAGFLSSYLYSVFLPFIFVALAVALGSALLAGDEEDGLLELLLSYPVRRVSAVTQKSGAMFVAVVGAGVLVVAIISVAGAAVGLEVGFGGLVPATAGTVLFGLLHGQLSMLAGAATGKKGLAVGVGWGVALGGYLLDVLSGLDASLTWLGRLSPLHHATAGDPLTGGVPPGYLLLGGALALASGLTVVVFDRHDLS